MTIPKLLGTVLLLHAWWLSPLPISLGVAGHQSNENDAQKKEAAMRILTTTLTAPNADIQSVLQDAKTLFPNLFDELELLQLVMDGSRSPSHVTVARPLPPPPQKKTARDTETLLEDIQDETPPNFYADRHIKRMNEAHLDYDCMEREFDLSSDDFDVDEAAAVFGKCRLLVLRNAWDAAVIAAYKTKISNYVANLHEGVLDAVHGSTTTGDSERLYVRRDKKRFDVLLPMYLRDPDIMLQAAMQDILTQLLGGQYIVNTVGCVMAESGAPAGRYHYDGQDLLGQDSLQKVGLAGSDIPPFAVSMFFPLLDTTLEHGPTEFCIGTNHYKGLTRESQVLDPDLVDSKFLELQAFEETREGPRSCPLENRRIPTPQMGDAILFDYTITHRGGANTSPELRAMPYIVYSRDWYREPNFSVTRYSEHEGEPTQEEELTQFTRFALVEEIHDCDDPPNCPERVPLESIHDFLKPAKHRRRRRMDKDSEEDSHNHYRDNVGNKHPTFEVKNFNVQDATLWVDNTKVDARLNVGASLNLRGSAGSKMELWTKHEKVKEWTIKENQRRIVLRDDRVTTTKQQQQQQQQPSTAARFSLPLGTLTEGDVNETVEEL